MTRTFPRWTTRLAMVAAAATAVLVAPATSAQAVDSWAFPLTATVSGRSSTNTAAPSIRDYANGTNVRITCQIYGSLAYGSYIWDKTTDDLWVTDAYVKTGATGFKSGIPRCGAVSIPTTDPGTNPYGISHTNGASLTPRANWVKNKVEATFTNATCTTRDEPDPSSDHSTGNAIDCAIGTIGVWPTLSQGERMMNLAGWVKQNAGPMKVQYVISVARIWNIDRASEGWRLYTAETGVTGGHYDHVHISVQN